MPLTLLLNKIYTMLAKQKDLDRFYFILTIRDIYNHIHMIKRKNTENRMLHHFMLIEMRLLRILRPLI